MISRPIITSFSWLSLKTFDKDAVITPRKAGKTFSSQHSLVIFNLFASRRCRPTKGNPALPNKETKIVDFYCALHTGRRSTSQGTRKVFSKLVKFRTNQASLVTKRPAAGGNMNRRLGKEGTSCSKNGLLRAWNVGNFKLKTHPTFKTTNKSGY